MPDLKCPVEKMPGWKNARSKKCSGEKMSGEKMHDYDIVKFTILQAPTRILLVFHFSNQISLTNLLALVVCNHSK